MGETVAGLVTDGPLQVAAAVAALAGLISFASPCVLPLVPGHLAYVTGLVGTGARTTAAAAVPAGCGGTATAVATRVDEASPRGRLVPFVFGFTAVLVAFEALFGGLSKLPQAVIPGVMGGITMVVGLAVLDWLPVRRRTKKLGVRPAAGLDEGPPL